MRTPTLMRYAQSKGCQASHTNFAIEADSSCINNLSNLVYHQRGWQRAWLHSAPVKRAEHMDDAGYEEGQDWEERKAQHRPSSRAGGRSCGLSWGMQEKAIAEQKQTLSWEKLREEMGVVLKSSRNPAKIRIHVLNTWSAAKWLYMTIWQIRHQRNLCCAKYWRYHAPKFGRFSHHMYFGDNSATLETRPKYWWGWWFQVFGNKLRYNC